MMLLVTIMISLVTGFAIEECSCTRPASIKELYNQNDLVFFAKIVGSSPVAKVQLPIKGCLEAGKSIWLMTDPDCPFTLRPTKHTLLLSGADFTRSDGSQAVILSSCGWTEKLSIKPEDLRWLNKQPLTCSSSENSATNVTTCVGGQEPLQCQGCGDSSGCKQFNTCQRNPCDGCSSYATEEGKIVCGNFGGAVQPAYSIHRGRPNDWLEHTHGKDVDPADYYDKIFTVDKVQQLDIVIHPNDYSAMEADLALLMTTYEEEMILRQQQKQQEKRDQEHRFDDNGSSPGDSKSIALRTMKEPGASDDESDDEPEKSMKDRLKDILKMQLLISMSGGSSGMQQQDMMKVMMMKDGMDMDALMEMMQQRAPPVSSAVSGLGSTSDPFAVGVDVGGSGRNSQSLSATQTRRQAAGPTLRTTAARETTNQDIVMQILQSKLQKKNKKKNNDRLDLKATWEAIDPVDRGMFYAWDPQYVPCDVQYGNQIWHQVGMRYKGGSTLFSAFKKNAGKKGFRLNFDRYEDEYPEIRNQRFYGLDKLTFSSMASDDTFIREVMARDLLKYSGLTTAHIGYVRVSLDVGGGSKYMGLYALIEDPADVLMETVSVAWDDDKGKGNLYKPEHNTWLKFNASHFEKKNNEDEADFSDIQAAITALNADRSQPELWRKQLEQVLDVDSFLRFLATANTMGHWDSYGMMPHNYYLYNRNGRLTWIPWDHNLALMDDDRMCSVMMNEVTEQWPLIRFLLDDRVYRASYISHIQSLLDGPFQVDRLMSKASDLLAVVAPHIRGGTVNGVLVEGEKAPFTLMDNPTKGFKQGIKELEAYLTQRVDVVKRALKNEEQAPG